jgi:hypothetical protein
MTATGNNQAGLRNWRSRAPFLRVTRAQDIRGTYVVHLPDFRRVRRVTREVEQRLLQPLLWRPEEAVPLSIAQQKRERKAERDEKYHELHDEFHFVA